MTTAWSAALTGVAGLHLGFQLTVTWMVYPALAQRAAAGPDEWTPAHAWHSRRIAPLVVLVYGLLVVVCVGSLLDDATTLRILAVLAIAVALAVTALVAAPVHGRLGREPPAALMTRLQVADVVRTVAAALGLVLACAAAA